MDLVGQPGYIHGPDSSINGGFLSSMPSPFQFSHLKEFQQPYLDVANDQILESKQPSVFLEDLLNAGMSCFIVPLSLFALLHG